MSDCPECKHPVHEHDGPCGWALTETFRDDVGIFAKPTGLEITDIVGECSCTHRTCYGRTVGKGVCRLPDGHYPDTHHRIDYGDKSWMAWTDESMAEFQRIADEKEST